MNTELVIFSPETLNAMKKDLTIYLKDLSKDISNPDVRITIMATCEDLNKIDKAIVELMNTPTELGAS